VLLKLHLRDTSTITRTSTSATGKQEEQFSYAAAVSSAIAMMRTTKSLDKGMISPRNFAGSYSTGDTASSTFNPEQTFKGAFGAALTASTDTSTFEVHVHVFQGRDMPAADANGLCDPYVVVRFMGHAAKTTCKPKTR
jgi:hypothetical protein